MLNKLSIMLCITILSVLFIGSIASSIGSAANTSYSVEVNSVPSYTVSSLFNDRDGDFQGNSHSTSENSDELFALLLIRSSASQFLNLAQIESHYFLTIEFLAEDLSAKLFKNLSNPPNYRPWYITCNYPQKKSKVSSWKDGNLLYKAILEYHS